ncbi:CAP domain-containing protein [Sphingomonas sp. LB-2]|uniref:CAP domain-containing protein n=1 Tax=Sphingomonas caeni TaxID=2984949 RepID=UPI0022327169|nr:CAP domain-containing protein [Sphingomonas caeni]MCW3848830.1 CAP domain-containing protein [Sphingomonas caeni]
MRTNAKFPAALGLCSIALIAAAAPTQAPAHLPVWRGLEAGVLQQVNYARTHPYEYAQGLREYRSHIRGGILYLPGDPGGIYTNEGTAAVDEAIEFLEAQEPLPPLTEGQILALAAGDHADAQGRMGEVGHISSDGADPGDRVKRRGGDIYVGESISYGFDDAENVVRQLIVDDGVPDRGHRDLLFTRDFRFAGVGCGTHREYRYMCVIDLSSTVNGAPEMPEWASNRGAKTFVYRGN